MLEPPPTDTKPSTPASRAKSAASWSESSVGSTRTRSHVTTSIPSASIRARHAVGMPGRRDAGVRDEQRARDAEPSQLPAGVVRGARAELHRRRLEREDRLARPRRSSIAHGARVRAPRRRRRCPRPVRRRRPGGLRDGLDRALLAAARGSSCGPRTPRRSPPSLRACAEHGAAIVPQGGNTGMVGGGRPARRRRSSSRLTRLGALGEIDRGTLQVDVGRGRHARRAAGARAPRGPRCRRRLRRPRQRDRSAGWWPPTRAACARSATGRCARASPGWRRCSRTAA